jgi:hypothetical protein
VPEGCERTLVAAKCDDADGCQSNDVCPKNLFPAQKVPAVHIRGWCVKSAHLPKPSGQDRCYVMSTSCHLSPLRTTCTNSLE